MVVSRPISGHPIYLATLTQLKSKPKTQRDLNEMQMGAQPGIQNVSKIYIYREVEAQWDLGSGIREL